MLVSYIQSPQVRAPHLGVFSLLLGTNIALPYGLFCAYLYIHDNYVSDLPSLIFTTPLLFLGN